MIDRSSEHLESIRQRVAASRYEVDPQAVASAIIERLIALRLALQDQERRGP